MSQTAEMIEPAFAEAIAVITASAELPQQRKAQWCSALRGLARCFNLPPESIPARFSAVRNKMKALKYPPFDWTAKTLANTKSNAKAALLWFRREEGFGSNGVSMTPSLAEAAPGAHGSQRALPPGAADAILLSHWRRACVRRRARPQPLSAAPGSDFDPRW